MLLLRSDVEYNEHVNGEILLLRNAMDALPSIETFCSSSIGRYNSVNIWFRVVGNNKQGLFFLSRCADRRYWKYGDSWNITLSIGDIFKNNVLPIHYCLCTVEENINNIPKQIISLIDNLNYHLNHKNFIKGFKLNIENFQTIETFKRKLLIEK